RGAPDDPRRPVRSGTPRWREPLAGVPAHHAADAPADAAAGEHPDGGRLCSAVRRALRDDAGRTAAEHGERALLHVRGGLQVVEPRFRLGGGVPAVPDDSGGHRDARALGPWSGAPMREPLARWLLHVLLLGAVALTLMPLLWMLSASFMTSGEASALPPPLLPGHGTLANYRQLFAQQNIGRCLANSLWLASITTALSVALQSLASFAFAHLPVDRAAGAAADPCHARSADLPRQLERLHVAADRAHRPESLHAADRARDPLARARAGQRADDGRRGAHGAAGAAAVPGAAALLHPRHPRGKRQGLIGASSVAPLSAMTLE